MGDIKMSSYNFNELVATCNKKPAILVDSLRFEEAVEIAKCMINNEKWDRNLQEYGVEVLEELRRRYPEKWNSSWRFDALLGYSYDVIFEYDKRFEAYNRAFKCADPKPPELLVALAGCCWTPGDPPISEEQAIQLTKEAIKNIQYIEAVELLRGLYKSTGKIKEQEYWDGILRKIKNTGQHLPSLAP
jgi:tetratricopeptide (TPR) repeat protein